MTLTQMLEICEAASVVTECSCDSFTKQYEGGCQCGCTLAQGRFKITFRIPTVRKLLEVATAAKGYIEAPTMTHEDAARENLCKAIAAMESE